VDAAPRSYTDTTGASGQLYYYAVKATNIAGDSPQSDETLALYNWTAVFNGTIGTLPEAQGWTVTNSWTRTPKVPATDGIEYVSAAGTLSYSSNTGTAIVLSNQIGWTIGFHCVAIGDQVYLKFTIPGSNPDVIPIEVSNTGIEYTQTGGGSGTLYAGDVSGHRVVINAQGVDSTALTMNLYIDGVLVNTVNDFKNSVLESTINSFLFREGSALEVKVTVLSFMAFIGGNKTPAQMVTLP
jgi:hypothetical protein